MAVNKLLTGGQKVPLCIDKLPELFHLLLSCNISYGSLRTELNIQHKAQLIINAKGKHFQANKILLLFLQLLLHAV